MSYGPQDSLQPVLEDTEVTLEFGTAEEGISGSAGCNHYFGGLTVRGDSLSVSDLGMTEMYCAGPEGVMAQETEYLEALSAAETFEIRNGQLYIACAGGLALVFDRTNS